MVRLPKWAERAMMPESGFATATYSWFKQTSATPGMQKFISGFLLREILDHFTQKTHSTLSPDRSLWMYFGHDYTVANMMNSLGVFWVHYRVILKKKSRKFVSEPRISNQYHSLISVDTSTTIRKLSFVRIIRRK